MILLAVFLAVQTALSFGGAVYLLDAANHFRPWITFALAIPILALALATRRGWPYGLASAALSLAILSAPALLYATRGTGAGGPALTVVSFNILNTNPRAQALARWLDAVEPDVIAIQEGAAAWRAWVETSPLSDFHRVAGSSARQGVELLAQMPLTDGRVLEAPQRRPVAMGVVDFGGPVCVVSIHPNTIRDASLWRARNADLATAAHWIGSQCPPGAEKLVMGDWNTAPWSPHFSAFLRANGLRWGNAALLPAATRELAAPFGWLGAPIDQIAMTSGLRAQRCRRGPALGSDHRPITCEIVRTRGG
ncbi:endonuclease/exonuclease/phosphatase family protein [Phenylobacterium sp. J426]|uniref:endonuclease/exonuclease/phosphatase family protein n=1 Tax=Phenylobacterium sp. J426 TaxID=2898439 RepID=UPI0021515448|nr:endonuclease/exonuclease/phosphatase family protein [Phenylobacterium sp. J426]MCR5876743.1 endonuclease/exonuclease/phosphatase family protein [Phenylobacterium sp. J426]